MSGDAGEMPVDWFGRVAGCGSRPGEEPESRCPPGDAEPGCPSPFGVGSWMWRCRTWRPRSRSRSSRGDIRIDGSIRPGRRPDGERRGGGERDDGMMSSSPLMAMFGRSGIGVGFRSKAPTETSPLETSRGGIDGLHAGRRRGVRRSRDGSVGPWSCPRTTAIVDGGPPCLGAGRCGGLDVPRRFLFGVQGSGGRLSAPESPSGSRSGTGVRRIALRSFDGDISIHSR